MKLVSDSQKKKQQQQQQLRDAALAVRPLVEIYGAVLLRRILTAEVKRQSRLAVLTAEKSRIESELSALSE